MDGGRVLVVDDEPGVRYVLARALAVTGLAVVEAGSRAEAERAQEDGPYVAAFVDIRLPDGSGLAVAGALAAGQPRPFVVVMTAQDTVAHAIEATRQGADEYLVKPFALADAQKLARSALERHRASVGQGAPGPVEAVASARPEEAGAYQLVGTSPAMREVYKRLGRASQVDLPVVVEGEPGSGKRLVARALHQAGPRRSGPMVVLDVLSGEEGEPARQALREAWSRAAGGTLRLDEPGAWSAARQETLLRLLAAEDARPADRRPRLVTVTSVPLATEQAAGRLRPELLLRLQVLTLRVPPLRERLEDLPALVDHFIAQQGGGVRLSAEALALLQRAELPGNLRQLAQLLAAARVESGGDTVTARVLEPLLAALGRAGGAPARWEEGFARLVRARLGATDAHAGLLLQAERIILQEALERAGGNQVRAAALLGLHRNSLRRRLEAALPRPEDGS